MMKMMDLYNAFQWEYDLMRFTTICPDFARAACQVEKACQ